MRATLLGAESTKPDACGKDRVAAPREPVRILELDGIRGLAILLVLQFHWAEGLTRMNPIESVFYQLLRTGWIGVDLFFVLSGFLITGILSDSMARPHYFRNFYARRILRIFPVYYGFLFFAGIVMPALLQLVHHKPLWQSSGYGWYLLYISNIGMALHAANAEGFGHFWSLAVEEQFYMFWPFLIYFLSRKAAMRACLVCVAVALVLRTSLVLLGVSHPAAVVLTPCRLDALAIGAWLALAKREQMLTAGFLRKTRLVFWAAALFLASLFIWSGWKLEVENPIMQSAGFTVTGILFGCLVVLTLQRGWFGFLKGRVFRFFGKYSYVIYVIHNPLHAPLWLAYRALHIKEYMPTEFLSLVLFFPFASFACAGLAVVSWRFYETQFLKLKSRFAD